MPSGERLTAASGSATWEWDLESGTASYSQAATALAGHPAAAEGLDRAGWTSRIHPEDAPGVAASVEAALAGSEERWTLSYRLVAGGGRVRRVRDRGFIVREQGRAIRALGVIEDDGATPPAAEQLDGMGAPAGEDGVRLYRALVDFIPQLCWTADASGWIDFYNQRWYSYTGTTPEQMEGWGWVEVHDPLDLPRMLRVWRNALATGEPWEDEFRLRRGSDGMLRWHLSRAMPLRDAQGRIVRWFGTNTEVHDQKLAAAEYARLLASEQHLRREAEAANKAKDEFLAVVSHELRTPLSVILNSAYLLRTGLPAEKQAAFVKRIEANAQLQVKLVSDILDVSRIISGKLQLEVEVVDVVPVVQQAVEEFRPAATAKGVLLSFVSPVAGPDAALVAGDAARLRQVVGNLLSNAVKFTPGRKAVEVRLDLEPESVSVTIRDEGAGIAPEFLPQLFRRFSQADSSSTRRHGGLGLGLSIVRELVELHGGTVTAHSEGLGRGATFGIRLPRSTATESAPPAPQAKTLGRASLTGLRILLVDDEPDLRATVAEMLLACGATVTAAGSVREAMQSLCLGAPDVVVTDIAMPEQDGYALLAQLRAQPGTVGRTPAIALTAYASAADRERAIAAGFERHLAKPADVGSLSHAIAEVCRDTALRPPSS